MANKCWKKIYAGKRVIRFENKNGTQLEIYSEKIDGKNKGFIAVSDSKTIRDKEFRNKIEAGKFAMKYMRNHC